MIKPYVYCLTHETGYFYIGVRWANKVPAEQDLGTFYFSSSTSELVRNDFANFTSKILIELASKDEAIDFEQDLITAHWGDPLLLNKAIQVSKHFRCDGHSEATKLKMSLAKKGKPPNNKGKKMSDHAKKILSERMKMQVHSKERREHMSKLRIGNTFGLGNKSRKGQQQSAAERLKKSLALKGRPGIKFTPEQKLKASEAAKKRPQFSCLICKCTKQINQFSRHMRLHNL